MKLTLILIPLLLFMTWCTIDWNDEKDKKITELEKQVTELKSNKELELQKFEFEKQKYEESKWLKEQEREDKFKKECAINKQKLVDQMTDLLNKNCTTQECMEKITSDTRFQIPSNYNENCLEKKLDWTWQWN